MSVATAIADVRDGFLRFPLWRYMAMRELRLKYARSFIGPIWITLTLAFWVTGISLLYGGLFGASLREVAPYITLGVIAWTYLTHVLNEGARSLISAKGFYMQSGLPFTTFVWLVVYRNLLIGGHHMLIFIVLIFIFGLWPNANLLWALAGLPIFIACSFAMSLLAAILTPRFTDLDPLIGSIMQVGFFLSPVMWRPTDLQRHGFIADFNPFTHLLSLFRDPFLGVAPSAYSFAFSIATTIIVAGVALTILARYSKRIPYWL